MKIFTYTLTSGVININASDGIQFMSILCGVGSSCTVLGNLEFQSLTPNAVTLNAGEGINVQTNLSSSPLDGIVITWVSGSVDIILTLL